MNTLFPSEPVRTPSGRYCTHSIGVEFARYRKCIVTEFRRKESVSRQLRQKDELIIELKNEIKRLKIENENLLFRSDINNYSNRF